MYSFRVYFLTIEEYVFSCDEALPQFFVLIVHCCTYLLPLIHKVTKAFCSLTPCFRCRQCFSLAYQLQLQVQVGQQFLTVVFLVFTPAFEELIFCCLYTRPQLIAALFIHIAYLFPQLCKVFECLGGLFKIIIISKLLSLLCQFKFRVVIFSYQLLRYFLPFGHLAV